MKEQICCRLQDWAQNIHDEMDPDKETVLLCHHGVRSMRVAGFLASQVIQLPSCSTTCSCSLVAALCGHHGCEAGCMVTHSKIADCDPLLVKTQKMVYNVQGFQKLRNVTGGIDAYSREVDSSVPQY